VNQVNKKKTLATDTPALRTPRPARRAQCEFTANGRAYRPPTLPIVAICLDGSSDDYLDAAMARQRMPNLQRIAVNGYRGLARGAMPSLTNVNNASIVTGVPPAVHGIAGNYFLDPSSGKEVMMNSAAFLRAPTIFAAAQRAGRKVAVITAKDKLRDIFASDLIPGGGIAFSAENARQARPRTHGIGAVESWAGPAPEIYSGEASLYVLRAGAQLIQRRATDFLYLSTTDFMQHKYAPEAPESLEFYAGIDEQIGHLLDLGAVLGLVADHGMNAKQKPDGSPNVVYLESELVQQFGPGFRVILPITDPYVRHHGALGSFAQVYLPAGNRVELSQVMDFARRLPGVTEALDQAAAAHLMELPPDRIGDFAVCSNRDTVLGRTPQWHDLKAIENGLRSHGGRYEEMVPLILSAPLKPEWLARARGDPRNFDIFDFLCNGTQT
jgi:phosphonoacetate hydrolase